MSYVVYTIISALFLAMYDLFKKISVKDKKEIYEILFFYTLIAFLCSFIFFDKIFDLKSINVFFILLKAIVISLSWFFTMKAMSRLQLSIVVPFSLLGTISTTILAFIFFDEKIGIAQIGGILIILLGLFLLSRLCRKTEKNENDCKCLILLTIAALLSSISAIVDRHLLNDIDRGSVLFWFFFFLSVIYLFICLVRNKKISFINLKSNLWVVGIGLSIFLSDLFYYMAVSKETATLSIISIIRKLSVFIGVVLGAIFLKEDNLIKKLFILILMFMGLAFVIFI